MRRWILLFPLIALVLGACDVFFETGIREAPKSPGRTRAFWAKDTRPDVQNPWYRVNATLLAVGTKSLIYADNAQLAAVSVSLAREIAAEFDNSIYPRIRASFGEESDVDGNGKILVLLLDIRDGYTGRGGFVAGYFDPLQLFSPEVANNSNAADMLYMDLNPTLEKGLDGFYGTMAHEYQHLINFNTTYIEGDKKPQDVWLNEGLSMAAEYVYAGEQLQNQLTWYNGPPDDQAAFSRLSEGNNFFVWGEDPKYALDEYATVYLFFQWLRVHAENGSLIYKEILKNPDQYRDYRAITSVAAKFIDPSFSNWEVLLRTWLGANLLGVKDRVGPLGFYGYGGEIVLTPPFTSATSTIDLKPGEGVYFGVSSSFTRTEGASIRYAGINTKGPSVDFSGPLYSGDVGIAYNVDGDPTGRAQLAYLPVTAVKPAPTGVLARYAGSFAPFPSSYPISIVLDEKGRYQRESFRPEGTAPLPDRAARRSPPSGEDL